MRVAGSPLKGLVPLLMVAEEKKEAIPDADGRKAWSQRMYEAIRKDKYAIGWSALMHVRLNGSDRHRQREARVI